MIDHYDWSGGREVMLRFGPDTGPVVVVALPLFEEANRMRAFAVTLCRALAERGVASVLPDLPGQGESLASTASMTLPDLRHAFQSAWLRINAKRAAHVVALRSGALLDPLPAPVGRWHLSPVSGDELRRDLDRICLAAGVTRASVEQAAVVEIAGNKISSQFLAELSGEHSVEGVSVRTLRLDTDPKHADRHVPGTPLWRRAEPDNDPALAGLLADDIADWIAACEG